MKIRVIRFNPMKLNKTTPCQKRYNEQQILSTNYNSRYEVYNSLIRTTITHIITKIIFKNIREKRAIVKYNGIELEWRTNR